MSPNPVIKRCKQCQVKYNGADCSDDHVVGGSQKRDSDHVVLIDIEGSVGNAGDLRKRIIDGSLYAAYVL